MWYELEHSNTLEKSYIKIAEIKVRPLTGIRFFYLVYLYENGLEVLTKYGLSMD